MNGDDWDWVNERPKSEKWTWAGRYGCRPVAASSGSRSFQLVVCFSGAKTYNYLGESYFETGKTEEAVEAFERLGVACEGRAAVALLERDGGSALAQLLNAKTATPATKARTRPH